MAKFPIKATIYHEDESKNMTTGMFLKQNKPNTQAYYQRVIQSYRGNGASAIRRINFYDAKTNQAVGFYTPADSFVMNYQPVK